MSIVNIIERDGSGVYSLDSWDIELLEKAGATIESQPDEPGWYYVELPNKQSCESEINLPELFLSLKCFLNKEKEK